ncbi:MAG: HAD family hydrolase [Deltaproteobacteria bacterium]|nr:HAD family hydrolase [Deltaproteobacteria bacterium]
MGDAFILLDLDGTILHLGWGDPEVHRARERLVALARAHALNPPHGMLIPSLAALGAQDPSILEALDEVEAVAARSARLCDGALAALDALGELPWAIVTSNGRPCAEAALRAVGLDAPRSRVMVCRGETRALKPDPEPLRRAVADLANVHGQPACVVMVGDAATDLQAAAALGREASYPVHGLGVLGGVSSERRFLEAGAARVLASLSQLSTALEELLPR